MSTGFGTEERAIIEHRALGLCERCGDPRNVNAHGAEVHHRRPRGMGGTSRGDTNRPANGLFLCGMCHRVIEDNRRQALMLGQLISQHRNVMPCEVPVLRRGEWVLLDDGGMYVHIPEPAGGRVS